MPWLLSAKGGTASAQMWRPATSFAGPVHGLSSGPGIEAAGAATGVAAVREDFLKATFQPRFESCACRQWEAQEEAQMLLVQRGCLETSVDDAEQHGGSAGRQVEEALTNAGILSSAACL